MSARRIAIAAALVAASVVVDVVGCDPGEPTLLPPPDSSWLDFGVDTGDDVGLCPAWDAGSDAASSDGVVSTDRGPVRGEKTSNGHAFRGIPYAAPPVGALRWRPPRVADCWSDVLDATKLAARCPQSDAAGTAPVQGSEDCLHVNVFTPSTSSSAPVMVFFHGGGFAIGSASDPTFDGGALARSQNVVVVTVDYRLGALGFLAHRALDVEDDHHASGNYGLLDQVAALQWVHRNAASFGGDAAHVTIVGQEAGGTSVCALLASPLARGLFSGAVLMSGQCGARSVADAEKQGTAIVAAAGCSSAVDTAQCMRALSAEAVVSAVPAVVSAASPDSPYGVSVDGFVLTGKPIDVVSAGGHTQVPVLLGNTSSETSREVPLATSATEADYEAAIAAHFAANQTAILAHYPASDYASPWAAYVALTTDAYDVCPTRTLARALLDGQDLPFYRYSFAHDGWQGAELPYLFGALSSPTAAESALSADVQAAWGRFATNGDPNGAPLLDWQPWPNDDFVFVFDLSLATQNGLRNVQCDFWDSLAP